MENSCYPRSSINILTILTTIMETILFFSLVGFHSDGIVMY